MANRRPQNFEHDQHVISYDHASVTADTTVKLFKALERHFRVDAVRYVNPTGLAADAADYFNLKVQNGATVIANWSTETGQEGALVADTFVDFTEAADDADMVLAPGDELSVVLDETGTQTLPAGRFQIEGRYL